MTKRTKRGPDDPTELRRRAEERLRGPVDRPAAERESWPPETKRIVHELQVHQIELELQNEELGRARAEVEQSLVRYADLYERAPVGYFTLDPAGEIRQVNLTGAGLLRTERSRLVGGRFGILVAEDSRADFGAFLTRIFEAGDGVESCELQMRAGDGGLLTVELTGTVSVEANECRVVATDITERRRLEAGLAQSERLASIGMLAASLTHEIANPLAYVLLDLETLLEELSGVDPELLRTAAFAGVVGRARQALEGSRRIQAVTDRLGAFARLDRGDRSRVDVSSTLASVATLAQNDIRHRATLVEELGTVPAVLASPGRLAQAFLNLLLNASQAIEEGHAEDNRITVRTWVEGDDVFVEVADTGAGIPPGNIERIFDPFFTTKGIGKGSGLGLAISRKILRELGGDLRVESQLGAGSRFRARLPVAPTPPTTVAREAPAIAPSPSRGRILIVDDELGIRTTLCRILERQHEVVTASSGREARAILEQDADFDMILSDMMMPDVTGMDLHQWLYGHSPVLADRLVLMSGGAFTRGAQEYLETSRCPVLDKPFDTAALRALVAERVGARAKR